MPETTDTDVTAEAADDVHARKVEYDEKGDGSPRLPFGGVHGRTADWDDGKRSWTAQSARSIPSDDIEPFTKFHPRELPDPEVALAAGFMPLVSPGHLISEDEADETMPPSGNYSVFHPARDVHRRDVSDSVGMKALEPAYEAAKAQTGATVEDAAVEDSDNEVPAVGDISTGTVESVDLTAS